MRVARVAAGDTGEALLLAAAVRHELAAQKVAQPDDRRVDLASDDVAQRVDLALALAGGPWLGRRRVAPLRLAIAQLSAVRPSS